MLAYLVSLLFIAIVLLPTTLSLSINIANFSTGTPQYTALSLNSYYTTIGDPPSTTSVYNVTLLRHLGCDLDRVADGSVLVFTGDVIPMFSDCNTAWQANSVTFARLAQRRGAAGVILKSVEKVCCCYVYNFLSFFIFFIVYRLLLFVIMIVCDSL
jgi:hypothetical protein